MTEKIFKRELLITILLTIVTIILTALFYFQLIPVLLILIKEGLKSLEISTAVYIVIATFILYGNLIYHLTRIGLFKRLLKHHILIENEIDEIFELDKLPTVTFLIPSYKEEVSVIEQTLWSAALQYYPNKRIVLLIDNPPDTKNGADIKLLLNTRKLVVDINKSFKYMQSLVKTQREIFTQSKNSASLDIGSEFDALENLFDDIGSYFSSHIVGYEIRNHVDDFYVKNIFNKWMTKLLQFKVKLRTYKVNNNKSDGEYLLKMYNLIFKMVDVHLESFERKTYFNLSHEPNKAMNINSYLHLIGKRVRTYTINNQKFLEETGDPKVKTLIPDSKYVVTLDADSILRLNYTIKLVAQMELEENSKVAVIQTPYSAYPNATKPVEVAAGATTDIQFNVHQGFTYYNSTYWVGANAMLRKDALNDIKLYEIQGDKVTVKYIQDRTVIEDTESSIDLVQKGWRLYNYPERLAYSSTPNDFGSLIIQRARWANGGLIIFPKLINYILKRPFDIKRWTEFFIRSNYLISIAAVNLGTLILLVYPFGDKVFTWWLPLAAVPYYILYTKDLKRAGYKRRNLFNVYCLNLILIPINIAGVLKSIEQGVTGRKIAFKRTPKIGNRVVTQIKFIAALYILFVYLVFSIFIDIYSGHISHFIYSFINASALLYSIGKFIGFKQSLHDVINQLSGFRLLPAWKSR